MLDAFAKLAMRVASQWPVLRASKLVCGMLSHVPCPEEHRSVIPASLCWASLVSAPGPETLYSAT